MKRKLRVSLLTAVLIVLLLAAVAFAAANHWGVMDFFKLYEQPIQPMESAKDMISSDLGSDENARLRMTVREAVYDGAVVRAVVEIAPAEGSNLLLVDPWSGQELDSGDGAGDSWREKAEASGKVLYTVDSPVLEQVSPSDGDTFEAGSDLYVLEGDSILFCLEGSIEGTVPESLRLKVSVAEPESLSVPFDLRKAGQAAAAKLVPDEASSTVCTILSATLHMTPLVGYAEVSYIPHEMPAAQMSDDSPVYTTKHGKYFHRTSECSGMKNALEMTYRQAVDSGKLPCPVCLSETSRKPLLEFELLNESGSKISALQDNWTEISDVEGVKGVYKTVGIFQPSQTLPKVLYLRPYDVDTGERFEPVRCTVALSQ